MKEVSTELEKKRQKKLKAQKGLQIYVYAVPCLCVD